MTKGKKEKSSGIRYTDRQIAQALALYDIEKNVSEVCRSTGASEKTVSKWIENRAKYEVGDGKLTAEQFQTIYETKKYQLLNECLELQSLALQQAKKKMDSASAYQAVLMFGILHDKLSGTGQYGGSGQTGNNFTFINMDQTEATELMQRVIERANSGKTDK